MRAATIIDCRQRVEFDFQVRFRRDRILEERVRVPLLRELVRVRVVTMDEKHLDLGGRQAEVAAETIDRIDRGSIGSN